MNAGRIEGWNLTDSYTLQQYVSSILQRTFNVSRTIASLTDTRFCWRTPGLRCSEERRTYEIN